MTTSKPNMNSYKDKNHNKDLGLKEILRLKQNFLATKKFDKKKLGSKRIWGKKKFWVPIVNITAERPKMKKLTVFYFLELLKFQKIKWSYFFSFLASRSRY